MRELDIQRRVELVANLILAISTSNRIIKIVNIATELIDEFSTPCSTCLPRRWIEPCKLIAFASDNQAATLITLAEKLTVRGRTHCSSVETMAARVLVYGSS